MKTSTVSYILNIILLILLVVGSTFFITKLKVQASDYDSMANFMEGEKEELINSNNLVVSEMKTINQNIVSSDEKIKELSEELSDYKKISSYTKAELLTEIKGINITYTPNTETDYVYIPDTNCVPIDSLNKYYAQMPKKVEYKDDWMKFNATAGINSFTLDSMSMINKFDVVIGEKVTGKRFLIFNKKEPTVDLRSYNPYTGIPYLNNITVAENRNTSGKVLSYIGVFTAGMITNQLIKQ